MSYKRQLWSSGYDYIIRCPYDGTSIKYRDRDLGYRAWFPNGFVYCPRCRKPLRHNEIYAVYPNGSPVYRTQEEANLAIVNGYRRAMGMPDLDSLPAQTNAQAAPASAPSPAPAAGVAYCPDCGRQYRKGLEHFCSACGKKLD
nr:hypothetical protein [Lachnospiraceae bacterium]